jgi:GntR family transcriptional regulator
LVWKFNDEQPIYQQIISQIKERIVAGEWKAGSKLKSVRELALEAGVNPNTMQKALAELEREGLVYSQRTAGRFVSDNKEKMTMECIKTFVAQMEKMGYKKEQIIEMLNKYISENK